MAEKMVLTWDQLPDVMTLAQAAEFLQISVNTLRRLCQSQTIPAVRVGVSWRINKSDLQRLMRKKDE